MLNVITAKFCSGSNQTWTKEVWQYDYGQVLLIEDVELPEAYEVHFSNMPIKGTAKPQIGNADGVTIPDEYFESGEPIYAWLFLHQGENDGETEKMITIPVKKRSKVVNEQPTPVEQSAITQAIAALNIAVEKAEDAIEHYPQIIDGTWHVWDVTAEEYVDTGVQAQGHDGEDGISPEITVQDITNGHRVTITDAGGTHTFDVMNGEQGATGNGIASIIKTGTSGLVDTYTITYTNGQTTTFTVTNGSDATVTVDSALSTTSENPVQNKVITGAVSQLSEDLSELGEDVFGDILQLNADIAAEKNRAEGEEARIEALFTAPTQEAVDNWLDEHPEATTTVQDGAITWAKLYEPVQHKIDSKAPGIVDTDGEDYNHTVAGIPQYVDIIGNDKTVGNVKLIDAVNILPKANVKRGDASNPTFEIIDYTGTINGYVGNYSGATIFDNIDLEIPAGNYKFLLYYDITGATVTAYNKLNFKFYVRYEGESSTTQILNVYPQTIGVAYESYSVALEHDVAKIVLQINLASTSTYNNAHFWYGLFPASANIIDTEQTAGSGDTIRYYGLNAISNAFCTMQNKSVLTSVVDTKTYIDDKEIDIDEELTYITPERFGAVGDYSTDDLTAWNLCIAYAIANNKAIRAYNRYKISDTLVIYGDDLDISVNKLRCTKANVECIRLRGSYNTLRFGTISGTGHGLKVISDGSSQSAENRIYGNMIAANTGDSLVLNGDTNGIYYNVFDVARYYTANGNCIVGNGERLVAENKFYNSRFSCPNGWAIYDCPGRYFGLSFEGDVLNAIYMISGGIYTFTGCRHGELTNKLINRISGESPSATGGTLIKYVQGAVLYLSDRYIPYPAIDISEAVPYDELTNDKILATMWGGARIIAPILIGTSYLTKSGWFQVGDQMFLQADKKICVPKYKSVYTITNADFDMRDTQVMLNNAKPYPTKMIIDVADCVIHLPTSYCSIGYSEFIVDQSDPTKLCTIYDSRDDTTPIFDGESLGAGVYKLTAYCNAADSIFPGSVVYIGNNTENDVWNIEKIS